MFKCIFSLATRSLCSIFTFIREKVVHRTTHVICHHLSLDWSLLVLRHKHFIHDFNGHFCKRRLCHIVELFFWFYHHVAIKNRLLVLNKVEKTRTNQASLLQTNTYLWCFYTTPLPHAEFPHILQYNSVIT